MGYRRLKDWLVYMKCKISGLHLCAFFRVPPWKQVTPAASLGPQFCLWGKKIEIIYKVYQKIHIWKYSRTNPLDILGPQRLEVVQCTFTGLDRRGHWRYLCNALNAICHHNKDYVYLCWQSLIFSDGGNPCSPHPCGRNTMCSAINIFLLNVLSGTKQAYVPVPTWVLGRTHCDLQEAWGERNKIRASCSRQPWRQNTPPPSRSKLDWQVQ